LIYYSFIYYVIYQFIYSNRNPKLLREKKIPIEFLMMSTNARYLARVSRDATELQNVMIILWMVKLIMCKGSWLIHHAVKIEKGRTV